MNVLVTGATGFVGVVVCRRLLADGHKVYGTVRSNRLPPHGVVARPITGLETYPSALLDDIEAVVHLAARVHVVWDRAKDPLSEFRSVNTEATLALAEAATRSVRRFVFISTLKVNGEGRGHSAYSEGDEAAPADHYGRSKWEAELGLRTLAERSGLKTTILRPPLVYGAGMRGNFLMLLKAVARRWPLPLAAIDNLRSLIHVENLADAISLVLRAPAGTCDTFLLSDGDISTPDLIRCLSAAMDRRPRLWSVAPATLVALGRLTGQGAAIARLTTSLRVDSSLIRTRLGWSPPVAMIDGLSDVARWYVRDLAKT